MKQNYYLKNRRKTQKILYNLEEMWYNITKKIIIMPLCVRILRRKKQ